MTWFKVDDGFYDHPKVENLSMAARGLWVTSGSWCAKQLTDGVISKKKVRQLGGTPAQIRGLIEAGLWFEFKDDSGAVCYAFRDWLDMQPSREQVKKSREQERERKRNWRTNKTGQTGDVQGERENVPAGQDAGQATGQDAGRDSLSRHPDPTRPDPTFYIDHSSQPSNGDHARGDGLAENFNLDDLAAATRRARAAGFDDAAISAGLEEFHKRPEPKGAGLLRVLIEDFGNQQKDLTAQQQAREQRRAAIDACPRCDNNGMRPTTAGAARCDHKELQPPFAQGA